MVPNGVRNNNGLVMVNWKRHTSSRHFILNLAPPTRRGRLPALALIACLAVGTVVPLGSSFRVQDSGQGASPSIDGARGRTSGLLFSPSLLNKVQARARVSKQKTVRSYATGRRAIPGWQASGFLFSTSCGPSGAGRRCKGFGRSPPSPTI